MKPQGAKFEYEQERNHDLMRVYRQLIDDSSFICMPEIYEEVVNRPSSRFWVSEERAAIVIAAMMKGKELTGMHANKREMFQEIYQRVLQLRELKPELSMSELIFQVVRQSAPKFYMTPGYAKIIICSVKKKWYEERKRRLRHLY